MKKKDIQEIRGKDQKILKKEIDKIRNEIAKLRISHYSSPTKDTNTVSKMRKKLAVMLTIYQEKISSEKKQ
jgi:ribosomal protein L29